MAHNQRLLYKKTKHKFSVVNGGESSEQETVDGRGIDFQ